MKNFLLMTGLLVTTMVVNAQQQNEKGKWQYFGLHQAGMLVGSNAEKIGLLTTNGISRHNWYTGISTGIDWYGLRTIPVLLSVYKAFGSNKHQPFVYGSAGPSLVWENEYSNRFTAYQYRTGFTGEAGLGYFINLKNKTAFTLSAAYSYKQLGMDEKLLFITDATPYGNFTTSESHYKFHYRRIAIRLGIKI